MCGGTEATFSFTWNCTVTGSGFSGQSSDSRYEAVSKGDRAEDVCQMTVTTSRLYVVHAHDCSCSSHMLSAAASETAVHGTHQPSASSTIQLKSNYNDKPPSVARCMHLYRVFQAGTDDISHSMTDISCQGVSSRPCTEQTGSCVCTQRGTSHIVSHSQCCCRCLDY